jgi:hypothetical protein
MPTRRPSPSLSKPCHRNRSIASRHARHAPRPSSQTPHLRLPLRRAFCPREGLLIAKDPRARRIMLLISACGNGARIAAVLPWAWVRDGSPNWTPATREWLTMSNAHVVFAVRNHLAPGTIVPTHRLSFDASVPQLAPASVPCA